MTSKIKINDLGGNLIGIFDYNELDENYVKSDKLEKALYNIYVKNRCLDNNKLIVLLNGEKHYYINFIYLKKDNLHFSQYYIISDELINNNLTLIFVDTPISINYIDAISSTGYIIDYLIINLLKNNYFAYFLLNINIDLLHFIPYECYKCNCYKELINKIIENYIDTQGYYLDEMKTYIELLQNKNFLISKALINNGYLLKCTAKELQADKEVVLSAVRTNGNALKYASIELQNDKEVAVTAIKNNKSAIIFVSHELFSNKEFILDILDIDTNVLLFVSIELLFNKEIILKAVKNNGLALQYADLILQSDTEIVLSAVKNNGLALEYASPNLKIDQEIIKEAIKNNSSAAKFIGPNFRLNYDEEIRASDLNILRHLRAYN